MLSWSNMINIDLGPLNREYMHLLLPYEIVNTCTYLMRLYQCLS